MEEVEHISSDSDSDETEVETRTKEPTLGIFPNHVQQVCKNFFIEIFRTMKQNLLLHFQGPTYLIFPSKNDKEQWLYHLTVVSGGDPKAGTGLFTFLQLFVYFFSIFCLHFFKKNLFSWNSFGATYSKTDGRRWQSSICHLETSTDDLFQRSY